MQNQPKANLGRAKGPLFVGYIALFLLVGVLGVWAVQARIAGAVIASGMIQVETNRQVIQHPEGGVVGALPVRDGDSVQAGEVVLRFDDTLVRSELAIITGQLSELRARQGRLGAERDDATDITFEPSLLESAATSEEVSELIEGQTRLFFTRLTALEQEETALTQQALQIDDQIKGADARLASTQTQAFLIKDELSDVQSLLDKGLAQKSRVLELQRAQARLDGEIGEFKSNIAQLRGDIERLKIERLRLRTARREEAIQELRDLEFREIELVERELATRETLSKMEVRAPVSGVIHGSRVFALQAVVSPAEPIMYVIPQDRPMVVSARIESIHIDQVHQGQAAAMRFVVFDQRTTPELFGAVTRISADVFTDEATGVSYYEAELIPDAGELDKLQGQALLPGMPVEAFIKTGERSPLSYLLKPFTDYFNKAMRET